MSAPVGTSVRDRLLAAAAELFYANGLAATGTNAVIDAAGVAKMSLYNNFRSKDDLVLAYIQARHEEWLNLYEKRRATSAGPAEGVVAVFDAYVDHAELGYEHGFRGCGLLNAAAELPVGSRGREAVRTHKEEVESILIHHLEQLTSVPLAAETAAHLSLLLEGSMARAGLEGNSARIQQAKGIAVSLVSTL